MPAVFLIVLAAGLEPIYIQPAGGRLGLRLLPKASSIFAIGKNANRVRLPAAGSARSQFVHSAIVILTTLASQSSRFIRKLCGGNLKTFANALCDSGLSKEDLQQLRQLLERDDL